jgi:acyl-coenzyme A thioesterase PaaI-like protein
MEWKGGSMDGHDVDLSPDPGWEDVSLMKHPDSPPSFVSGDPASDRIRVKYYKRTEDGALVGKAWFGPGTQGPPGHAHGGSQAALLDEVMGGGAWLAGHPVLAAQITVQFKRMLPIGTLTTVEGCVHEVNGKKVTMKGRLVGPDGESYSESEGLFILLDAEKLARFADTMPKK